MNEVVVPVRLPRSDEGELVFVKHECVLNGWDRRIRKVNGISTCVVMLTAFGSFELVVVKHECVLNDD